MRNSGLVMLRWSGEAQTEDLAPAYLFMFPRLSKEYPRFACLQNGFNLFSVKRIIIVSFD